MKWKVSEKIFFKANTTIIVWKDLSIAKKIRLKIWDKVMVVDRTVGLTQCRLHNKTKTKNYANKTISYC